MPKLLLSELFLADSTLIEIWASLMRGVPKDRSGLLPPEGGGRNTERNFHGGKRVSRLTLRELIPMHVRSIVPFAVPQIIPRTYGADQEPSPSFSPLQTARNPVSKADILEFNPQSESHSIIV